MKIGFICVGNSARSQMAEGFAKEISQRSGKDIEVFSAGLKPSGYVHPLAIEVMKEVGIDISSQKSKGLKEIPYFGLNIVVTLCGEAEETCPFVPSKRYLHWDLKDPAKENTIEAFRESRDKIQKLVEELLASL
jgi:arsenate reductase